MATQQLRVVHYLNQFFGGIGGEDKADVRPTVKVGIVGPGALLQKALGDEATVVLGTLLLASGEPLVMPAEAMAEMEMEATPAP